MSNKYKDTLQIGKTSFEMKANLNSKEISFQEFWSTNNIYNKKLELNKNKPLFMLHDGPPYANGDLHIGHALNKILKDILIRYKNYNGFYAPFIMGWDTHGLPIETAVIKQGIDRKKTPPVDFRKHCEKYALKQVDNQTKQFNRLGMFTDYNVKYVTLTHNYEMSQLKLFEKMYKKGLIFKSLKPVFWSPSSESALADSEVEYKDVKSPSIYIACNIVSENYKNLSAIIWTTTPWTIPSNQFIAISDKFEYSIIKVDNDDRNYIVCTNLIDSIKNSIGWEKVEIISQISTDELINLKYEHPLYDNKISKIIIGHHVTDESGTGLVHIAGGFGEDDYLLVKQNNEEPFAPINNQGKFTNEIEKLDPSLVGKFYDDTNKEITERLNEKNNLLKLKFVVHSYPHDWRTKKPVIYRCTLQWFANIEPVKTEILDNIKTIDTHPKWAKSRLYNIINERSDWTISRQRLWGVPIIAFYNENDELVLNEEILNYALSVIDKLKTNSWFELPADTFLPEKYRNQNLKKEKDILDVWYDSGSSAIALSERFPEFKLPYDMYLEGNDQYRGWFNASMINSVIYANKSPYKTLVSHGMTVDEKGNKMSKSMGNGIDPINFANTTGADILRLWVSSVDYTSNQKIGPEIIKQISETYRKIRNTIRFIISNINDFNPVDDYKKDLEDVDKFALHEMSVFKEKVIAAYDSLQFNLVYTLTINYITKNLSSFYLDFIKDILYIDAKNSTRRRQVQTVLYEQLWCLIDVLKPILIHTIEEVYQNLNIDNKELSVHLLDIKKQSFIQNEDFLYQWESVLKLRDDVNKALENARQEKIITKGFEAIVNIKLNDDYKFLENINDLDKIFIVNSIIFENSSDENYNDYDISQIKITQKIGEKCQRCWSIVDQLVNGEICDKCENIIKEI